MTSENGTMKPTVIGIDTLVVALEPLPALVTGYPECYPVLLSQLFQFGHDAGGDNGRAFCVETVHHGGEELEFALDGVGEEVLPLVSFDSDWENVEVPYSIDKHVVGRHQGSVVLEEQVGRDLRDFAHDIVSLLFGVGGVGGNLVLLEAGVALANDALGLGELACAFCDTHSGGGVVCV